LADDRLLGGTDPLAIHAATDGRFTHEAKRPEDGFPAPARQWGASAQQDAG
jgi:hypothetical protein